MRGLWFIGIGLFFLAQKRDFRWFGLVLVTFSYVLFPLTGFYGVLPVSLMNGFFMALIFAVWWLDLRIRTDRDHRLTD
jgi:hypothetical protein